MTATKVCRACGVEKPREQFYASTDFSDGTKNECIPCYRAEALARYHRKNLVAQEDVRVLGKGGMPKRCRQCRRMDREFYARGDTDAPARLMSVCKVCHSGNAARRKREQTKKARADARAEQRRLGNQLQVRRLILEPNLLDVLDRSERRQELEWFGLEGLRDFRARYRAVHGVKVLMDGGAIPPEILDQILPPGPAACAG
jgi:hypothetical protein